MRPSHLSDPVTPPEILACPRTARHEQPDTTLPPVFLVPVSYSRPSEAALHLALALAAPSGAKLLIVHVVPRHGAQHASRSSEDAILIDREATRLRTFVDGLFSEARAKTKHELIVAIDTAAPRKIAELAAAHGAALIIMGASSDDIRRRLFGSIVERTRRQAACPVVTIGASRPAP